MCAPYPPIYPHCPRLWPHPGTPMTIDSPALGFADLGLAAPVLDAIKAVGYETPSPVQAQAIPFLLQGKDVLGQAQTGTGKTAAFALPLLSRIDTGLKHPQVLVLAPTRELAIQVAEAFQSYAAKMPGLHVLPIYGGQDFGIQLKQLKRGVHIVVGTPGRVMDHMRRKTLKLDSLRCLVLDEADEMLRMGFIDDVEWILEQTPEEHQTALFSATMPTAIRKIAEQYLHEPEQVTIKVKTTTAETIRQRYWLVSGMKKLDALTRMLEVETFDGMIIFVRTKNTTGELAEKLQARGYSSVALNGDINQSQRERIVQQFKKGGYDILVATDVAARGLDVERISHVINYDIPYDTEAYVHRIGRTGRAGRTGDAILFVVPREKRLLRAVERATRQDIKPMELPSTEAINDRRIERFKQRISDTLGGDLGFYQQLLEQYLKEHNVPELEVAAALAKLLHGNEPLLLQTSSRKKKQADKGQDFKREDDKPRSKSRSRTKQSRPAGPGMEKYCLEVGHVHEVTPSHIVGAIASEAELDSEYIGRIEINDDYSTIDLPEGMPKEIFRHLKKVRVMGQPLNLSLMDGKGSRGNDAPKRQPQKRPGKGHKVGKPANASKRYKAGKR